MSGKIPISEPVDFHWLVLVPLSDAAALRQVLQHAS